MKKFKFAIFAILAGLFICAMIGCQNVLYAEYYGNGISVDYGMVNRLLNENKIMEIDDLIKYRAVTGVKKVEDLKINIYRIGRVQTVFLMVSAEVTQKKVILYSWQIPKALNN
ncbi:hypothetical protein FACS1894152_7240 [Bacilli bacterium]|nr:hypothetical protein FACS1894152_7240 [Bacilli bacterium]